MPKINLMEENKEREDYAVFLDPSYEVGALENRFLSMRGKRNTLGSSTRPKKQEKRLGDFWEESGTDASWSVI